MTQLNVADRFGILNVVSLCSLLYDDGRLDEWAALFAKRATFTIDEALPVQSTTTVNGRAELHRVAVNASARRHEIGQERHLLINVAVTEQSDDTAEIAAILLMVRTSTDGRTVSETPGRYTGTLVKEDDGWKTDRWYVHLDADRDGNLR